MAATSKAAAVPAHVRKLAYCAEPLLHMPEVPGILAMPRNAVVDPPGDRGVKLAGAGNEGRDVTHRRTMQGATRSAR